MEKINRICTNCNHILIKNAKYFRLLNVITCDDCSVPPSPPVEAVFSIEGRKQLVEPFSINKTMGGTSYLQVTGCECVCGEGRGEEPY